jgi:Tol biopolymer transport system component
MSVTPGTRLGPYEITAFIGAGGMGEVYRARDSRLQRDVAIKVLPAARGVDTDALRRFEREAQLLASLNHPNIATLHALEMFGEAPALVMEFVEGVGLDDKLALAATGMPLSDAVDIARQIADALDAAHECGVIHRDLKPANIRIRPDNTVKVLDFGIAKAFELDASSRSALAVTMTATAGAIVGTPAYMSPEQASGGVVDRRTDIWAFGCVLFEMLSAKQAFGGESRAETVGKVLGTEADWNALPSHTPGAVRRILQRCLRKDVRARFHDIADVRIDLDDVQNTPVAIASAAPLGVTWWARALWAGAAAVVAFSAAWLLFASRPAFPELPLQFDLVTPPEGDMVSLAVSSDGSRVVFAGLHNNEPYLWLRSLRVSSASQSSVSQRLDGTLGASMPFWSPNDESVGFFADGQLKRVDIATGNVQFLAATTTIPTGGTWNGDGVIVYSPGISGGIFRVRDQPGGRPTGLPSASDGISPRFLPDGNHFLFQVPSGKNAGIYVGSIDGSVRHKLAVDGTFPEFLSRGQLLYLRNGTLFARRFNPNRYQAPVGEETLVAERVAVSADGLTAAISAGGAGVLAFRALAASDTRPRRLTWFNRLGEEIATVGELSSSGPALAPNGRLIVMDRNVGGLNDIWKLEDNRLDPVTRFTAGGALTPVFAPTGRTVAFAHQNTVTGVVDLFTATLHGGKPEPLLETTASKAPTDWTKAPDGHEYLLFRNNASAEGEPNNGLGIWAFATSPVKGEPFPVVDSEFMERDGVFSPDGFSREARWIAYESNRSGRPEIYVHPFPGPGAEKPVSTTGGTQVRWSHDGKELFYIALDGYLMAVKIFLRAGGEIGVGDPQPLFRTRVGASVPSIRSQQYVVSSDGQRFLMSVIPEQSLTPLTLRINWPPR